MPLTEKGSEIMSNMKKEYGSEEGERVFYASKNKGNISGVDCQDDCTQTDSAAHGLPAGYPENSTSTEPLPSAPEAAPHVSVGMTDSPMEHLPMTIRPQDSFDHAQHRWDVWNCNVPPGEK